MIPVLIFEISFATFVFSNLIDVLCVTAVPT